MNTTTTTTQRAYRFRVYLTKEQENLLRRTIGCCRKVYNMALEYRTTEWQRDQHKVSYEDTAKLLKEWKRRGVYPIQPLWKEVRKQPKLKLTLFAFCKSMLSQRWFVHVFFVLAKYIF